MTGGVINQAPGAGTAPVVPKTEAKAEPKVGQSGVSAAQVEAAVAAAAQAAKLPTAEVIGKQPMTQIFQVSRGVSREGASLSIDNSFARRNYISFSN